MKYIAFIFLFLTTFLNANNFYYEFGKKVELQPKINSKSINSTASEIMQYKTIDGKTMKFRNEILVQCEDNAYCEDDFSDLSLDNYKKIGPSNFLIKLNGTQDIFEYCQKLYEKDDIKSAHPNYIRSIIKK